MPLDKPAHCLGVIVKKDYAEETELSVRWRTQRVPRPTLPRADAWLLTCLGQCPSKRSRPFTLPCGCEMDCCSVALRPPSTQPLHSPIPPCSVDGLHLVPPILERLPCLDQ